MQYSGYTKGQIEDSSDKLLKRIKGKQGGNIFNILSLLILQQFFVSNFSELIRLFLFKTNMLNSIQRKDMCLVHCALFIHFGGIIWEMKLSILKLLID